MEKLILIVEDDDTVRDLLLEVFNDSSKYKATSAENGARTLELVKAVTFNLVTLDIDMPEMNGNQFLEGLNEVAPSTPVLIISANLKKLKQTAQVKAKVAKPFDIEQILALADKYA